MKKHPPAVTALLIKKIAALLLSAALTLPAYAAPAPARPAAFSVPVESGSVENFVQGNLDKTVYYIQDAHDSLDAQKNIARLIEELEPDIVFEEGYAGPVPTDAFFGSLGETEKQNVSAFLLDRLRIGGAEYAHIHRKKEFSLIGADDVRLHRANLRWYRRAAKGSQKTAAVLARIERDIKTLTDLRFPGPLKEWFRLKERFDRKTLPLTDYILRCRNLAGGMPGRYPSIELLLEGLENPETLNQIDAHRLFQEIAGMEEALAAQFLTKEADRLLFGHDQSVRLLKRLNRLELSSAEFEAVRETLHSFNAQTIARFLADETRKPVVLPRRWEKSLRAAVKFYETARLRDEAVKKRIASFVESKNKRAVLVFGGFHKKRIEEILRESGVTFAVLTPAMNGVSPRHQSYYRQLMSEGRFGFETPADASTPERIFSLMDASQFPDYLERARASEAWAEWAAARAELRESGPGFGEFAVMAGDERLFTSAIRLEEAVPLAFYFNIHTDTYLEKPEERIKARVWYEKRPGQWGPGPELKIYDNFGNGVYRAGITLPSYVSGQVTFQYSIDGGLTWKWANSGPGDNYAVERFRTVEAGGKNYEVRRLQNEEIQALAWLDARLPDSEEKWTAPLFTHLAEDYDPVVFAVVERAKPLAYLALTASESGLTIVKYAVAPSAPRELLTALWESAKSHAAGEPSGVLRIDSRFEDLSYFGQSILQTVKKLPAQEDRPAHYAITYRAAAREPGQTEEEVIPIELPPSDTAMLRAWAKRHRPGTRLKETLAEVTKRFPHAPEPLVRRTLGERRLEPEGGFNLPFQVRDMTNDDVADVMQIEESEFDVPVKWSPYGFIRDERTPSEVEAAGGGLLDETSADATRIRRVAVVNGRVAGYLVYKIYEERIDIQRLVVDPSFRFSGIEAGFMNEVKQAMKNSGLAFIAAQVEKDDLPALKFYEEHLFAMLPEQEQSWNNKDRPEMVYWDPEIDASMLRSKAQASRYLRWLKKTKAELEEIEKEKLARSPESVIHGLARKTINPWKKNAAGRGGLSNIRIRDALPGHAADLARFAREYSRFRWTEQDFRDFLEKGGSIAILRSHGYINGFIIYEKQGADYRIYDAALVPHFKFAGFLKRFIDRINREDEAAERILWEIDERDFENINGKETLVRAGKFQALEVYETGNGGEKASAFMLQRYIREIPEGIRLLRRWAQSLERTPVSYASAVAQAEEFGLELSFVYDELKRFGIAVLPPGTGKESVIRTNRASKNVHIRWMIRRDMPEVNDIESASYVHPWEEEDFLRALRQRNVIGMVAEAGGEKIIGFMVYELHRDALYILNLAVDPRERFQTVGTQMIARLIDKLSQQRRTSLFIEVRERNLAAQVFLQKNGFKAIRIEREFFEDTGEDAYVFAYHLPESEPADYKESNSGSLELTESEDDNRVSLKIPLEADISEQALLAAWAKRQPLEALDAETAARRHPDLGFDTIQNLLDPVRKEKLTGWLITRSAELETGRVPETMPELIRLSSLPSIQVQRLLGELGLKTSDFKPRPLEVQIRDGDSTNFHDFELMEPPDFLTRREGWTFQDFDEAFEQGYRAYTAFDGAKAVGYVLYRKTGPHIQILKVRTRPEQRFRGIEEQLLEHLKNDPANEGYGKISVFVPETDVYLQVLLRNFQFESGSLLPGDETADRLINFTYRRPVSANPPSAIKPARHDRVFVRYHEGAVAIHLTGKGHEVLHIEIQDLDTVLKDIFGAETIVRPADMSLSWKTNDGRTVTRSLRSSKEIKEIQAFLQDRLEKLKSGAGSESSVPEDSAGGKSELRDTSFFTGGQTPAERIENFSGKYAVVADLEIFAALSPGQKAEYYKLFEAFSGSGAVRFIFTGPADAVPSELLDFRRQYSHVEIRTDTTSSIDLRDRKTLNISRDGMEDRTAGRISADGRVYRVRYTQKKESGLLTAALLLLEAGRDDAFTAEGFSEVPSSLAADIQNFLDSYIYAARSA